MEAHTNTNNNNNHHHSHSHHHTHHRRHTHHTHTQSHTHTRTNDVSHIPLDAIAGPATGGSTFGEDYQVHRSVMPLPRMHVHSNNNNGGGLEVVAPSLAPAGVSMSMYMGGARYSPTGLPLADVTPLKYSKDMKEPEGLPKTVSSESEVTVEGMVVVPQAPIFLEPNNHVFLRGNGRSSGSSAGGAVSVGQVQQLVEQTFARCQVDYTFTPHKCKWKAARHLKHASVDFRARVYYYEGEDTHTHTHTHEGRKGEVLVVEFQKRQGDASLMQEAFEKFLALAEGQGLIRQLCPRKAPPAEFGRSECMVGVHQHAHAHTHQRVLSGSGGSVSGNGSNHINSSIKHASAFASAGFGGSGMAYFPPPTFGRSSFNTHTHTTTTTTTSTTSSSSSSGPFTTPQPSHTPTYTHTQPLSSPPSLASTSLHPLLQMAESDCRKASLEATLALAKLSASEDNRALMKEAGAIPVLVRLVSLSHTHTHTHPQVRQAAVTALSNLSESASCKPPLVEAGAVSGLLSLLAQGGNGNTHTHTRTHTHTETAKSLQQQQQQESSSSGLGGCMYYLELEMRRESARTLANLSEDHAAVIVREVGKDGIKQFIKSVDALADERLKMHARRFKSRVGVCC